MTTLKLKAIVARPNGIRTGNAVGDRQNEDLKV